jgi:nucleoside 2-deoxyribosyltransferase
MSKKIYLAIPYTWNAKKSFEIANKVSAELMNLGYVVFSPISHSHSIAEYLDEKLRYNNDFWMHQDLPFVEWADELKVVVIGEFGHELIFESKGVQQEINKAIDLGIKISLYEYND